MRLFLEWLEKIWAPRAVLETGDGRPPLRRFRERSFHAWLLVRGYYAFLAFVVLGEAGRWERMLDRPLMEPLWPVMWLEGAAWPWGMGVVLVGTLAGALAACCWTRLQGVRIGVAIFYLMQVAAQNSFGKISHTQHAMVLVALLLALLPTLPACGRCGWKAGHRVILVVQAVQVLLLATYTLSGFWKVWYGIAQALDGKPGSFHPSSFALHIAEQMLQTGEPPWLARFFLALGVGLWPLMLGALYFQVASLWVAGRPSLHRFWAVLLVVFHVFSQWTLGVGFDLNCFLLLLFLGMTPFAPAYFDLRQMGRDLPLLGICLARLPFFRKN
jgi:hypothetical protein